MQYSIVKRVNPQDESDIKYYCQPRYGEKITLRDIAEDLSDASTLNSIDIMAVIEGFIKAIVKYTVKGNRVYLGDFGIFKLIFGSVGQKSKELVSSADIDNVRIVFRAGNFVKKTLSNKTSFYVVGGNADGKTGEANEE